MLLTKWFNWFVAILHRIAIKGNKESVMNNNERFDLSDNLIHFFRAIDPDDGSMPVFLDDWGMTNIEEGGVLYPLFLLRTSIRYNVLWSTWSYRGGKRTVYGPNPAVCFTEMPIAAFLETARMRSGNGEKISSYAFIFDKKQMFQLGARPVIYGLSVNASLPIGNGGCARIFDESILPLAEQYRYVTYNPVGQHCIDWTHEREWRWPYTEPTDTYEKELEQYGCVDDPSTVPGLWSATSFLENIGIIVKSEDEREKILYDILCLIYRKVISPQKYNYIICYDAIADLVKLRDYGESKKLIESSKIDIAHFLEKNTILADNTIRRISELENMVDEQHEFEKVRENGKCWLWLYDFFDEKVRSMLNEDYLKVNKDGKILYELNYISDARDLRQQEMMVEKLADCVKKELRIECGYFSVCDRGKPYDMDSVPFYNSEILDERLHNLYYNYNNA